MRNSALIWLLNSVLVVAKWNFNQIVPWPAALIALDSIKPCGESGALSWQRNYNRRWQIFQCWIKHRKIFMAVKRFSWREESMFQSQLSESFVSTERRRRTNCNMLISWHEVSNTFTVSYRLLAFSSDKLMHTSRIANSTSRWDYWLHCKRAV